MQNVNRQESPLKQASYRRWERWVGQGGFPSPHRASLQTGSGSSVFKCHTRCCPWGLCSVIDAAAALKFPECQKVTWVTSNHNQKKPKRGRPGMQRNTAVGAGLKERKKLSYAPRRKALHKSKRPIKAEKESSIERAYRQRAYSYLCILRSAQIPMLITAVRVRWESHAQPHVQVY